MLKEETVLVVDDDVDHLALVERFVNFAGARCIAVASANEALSCLEQEKINFIVTDMVMPEVDGMALLKICNKRYPEISVIVMTGYSNDYCYMDVIQAGAADFLSKPFQKEEFVAKMSRILRERQLVVELRSAKDKADAGNRAKTTFLNTVGHELRTPMNGIIGFTQLLADSSLPEVEKEYVAIVEQSANRLMKLIEQILDYSAIGEAKNGLRLEHFYLDNLFEVLFKKLKPKALDRGLELILEIEKELAKTLLFGAQLALLQILSNLLDNAIRFTDAGMIVIRVKKDADLSDGWVKLHFSMTDSGCGIDFDRQGDIFQPFTQVENCLTREHNGAGLGLAACSKFLDTLGGRIWVQSARGAGSTFCFTIPLEQVL